MNPPVPQEADDAQPLRLSQRENELLLQAIPDMLLRVRRDGTYLSFKPPRDFQPWKQDSEVVGKNVRDSIPPAAAEQALRAIARALDTGQTQHLLVELPGEDGPRHRDVRIVPASGDEALIMIRDVTEHRRTEQQRDAYIRLTEAIRRVQSGLITQSEYAAVFRTALEELLALTSSEFGFLAEVLHKPDGTPSLRTLALTDISWDAATRARFDEMSTRGMEFENLENLFSAAFRDEQVVISADPANDPRRGGLPPGHPPLRCFLGVPMRHERRIIGVAGFANRPGGYDVALVDYVEPLLASCSTMIATYHYQRQRIEDQRRLEQQQAQLTHVVRLSTMGEMVAGLAHELTQPLGAIGNYASAAATTLHQAGPLHRENLLRWNERIAEQAARAGAIIDRLRQFARRGEPRGDLLDVRQVVAQAVELAEVIARRLRCKIDWQCHSNAKIQADRVQIQQVILNLISNAAEAMHAAPHSRGQIQVHVANDEREVVISVADDGIGLAPEAHEQIFEAFYTTKPDGLGMGLPICRSIAGAHGGRIWFTRNPEQGTTFHLAIPRRP